MEQLLPTPRSSRSSSTSSSVLVAKVSKLKVRRSRNGCVSCKRLKIKCDEGRPSCEYCRHTNRYCEYPEQPQKKTNALPVASMNSLVNHHVGRLNSPTVQLGVSLFELRLLRDFIDFGAACLSLDSDEDLNKFWRFEAPSLFNATELMRSAILAISGLNLLTQFEFNSIHNVHISDSDDESLVVYSDASLARGQSVCQRANSYLDQTLVIMRQMLRDDSIIDDVELSAQIIAVNILIYVIITAHPISPLSLVCFDGTKTDLIDICRDFIRGVFSRHMTIIGTKFECLLYPRDRKFMLPEDESEQFAFIEYLKTYVDTHVDIDSHRYIIYQAIITTMEMGCYRAYMSGYMVPVFRIMINTTRSNDFVQLLRDKDYIALKTMFYLSCVCSIGGFKFFSNRGVWDSFIMMFKDIAFSLFGGKFEDEFDENMYMATIRSMDKAYMFDIEFLKTMGSSSDMVDLTAGFEEVLISEEVLQTISPLASTVSPH